MTRRVTSLFGALVACLVTAQAMAQDGAGDRATSFQAVSGSAHEDVPGGTLLVAAYAIVLCLLAAYVAYLTALQRSTAKEITRLEGVLAGKTAKPEQKKSESED